MYQVAGVASLARIGADVVGNVARIWTYPMNRETLAGITPQTVIANATTSSIQNLTLQTSDQYSFGGMERMTFLNKRAFLALGMRFTKNDSVTRTGAAGQSR